MRVHPSTRKRRRRALAGLTAIAVTFSGAVAASGAIINSTNDGYSVDYTPDDGMNPLTAAEFPDLQAQRILDAKSNTNTSTLGNPNGYHNGYTSLGFVDPDFDGDPRRTFVMDCSTLSGGCDSGMANHTQIVMPAAMYRNASEACVRAVIGHELFHHIEYGSVGFDNRSAWGKDSLEGTARVMQDRIYSDLDTTSNAGCAGDYLNEVNNYLATPGTTLWGRSYTTALFWSYLMEQLGQDTAEPTAGADFMVKFWANAGAAGDNRDLLATIRKTIHDFDSTKSLEQIFHDFTIANYTKLMDVGALPDGAKYRYRDEQQTGATAYASVPVTNEGSIPPNVGPKKASVARWASTYVQADIGDCTGVAGFVADGDKAGFAMVSQNGNTVTRIDKSVTNHFARAVLVRSRKDKNKRVTRLGAVITGLNDAIDTNYKFACGSYTLEVKSPTIGDPVAVGKKSAPNRLLVRAVVHGPSELGTPSVEGLRPDDFTATIAGQPATVLGGAYVQGEYWLTVQPPAIPAASADLQNLTLTLGDVNTTQTNAVLYAERHLDQMLTIDRSGSMKEPAAAPKIDAARNAASLFVDVAPSDDKLGVVSFSGDNSEPNDDSSLDAMLSTMTDPNRDLARAKVLGLIADGMTSIGDGIAKSASEYPIRGTALGEDHIVLLSDGMENEGQFWHDVRASVVAAGIKVDTIALGPLTDQALLQQIAADTGGKYYYVEVSSAGNSSISAHGKGTVKKGLASLQGMTARTAAVSGPTSIANALANVYANTNERAQGQERFWQETENLPAGSSTSKTITVDEEGMTDGTIAINWTDENEPLKVALTDPDGNVITPGVGGASVVETRTHTVFRLPKLTRGDWTLDLTGAGADQRWVGVAAAVPGKGTSMWTAVGDSHPGNRKQASGWHRWGEQIPVLAGLTDKTGPVRGGSVVATVTHPDGTPIRLPLLDDGNHGDGAAEDGVYGNTYTRTTEFATKGADDDSPKQVGSYQVLIGAQGVNGLGEKYQRYAPESFALYENGDPKPDTDGDGMPDLYEGYHSCLNPADPADIGEDQDSDGLSTKEEWFEGTDPCNPDTDHGGESDASELARKANPFDPADDALPRPEDPSVIDDNIDHMPRPDFQPESLLIRYPANSAYASIRLLRSTNPGGPFAQVADFDSTANGGIYRDTGLTNDVTYYYKVQAVDLNGSTSAASPVFSGTPRKEPAPPIGQVKINEGRPFSPSVNVKLALSADDDDVVEMRVGNSPDLAGSAWEPFADSKAWAVSPDVNGRAVVYAQYRDKAGNVSNIIEDAIQVRSGLRSYQGVLDPDTAPSDGAADGVWISVEGQPDLQLVSTDAAGTFVLEDVPTGTYKVSAQGAGYRTKEPVELQQVGTTPVPVVCDGTC